MSRDRPTNIGIGIIRFNARTNSVCSTPSSCTASSRRVDTLSVGAELSSVEQRFVELCANDEEGDAAAGAAAVNSAAVSEADECDSVADECENLAQECGIALSPSDVPVEEVIKSVKLAKTTVPLNSTQKTDAKPIGATKIAWHHRFHQFWHKLLGTVRHYRTLPFPRLRLLSVAFFLIAFFSLPSFLTGLLTGVYLSLLTFLFLCVSEPMSSQWRRHHHQQQRLAPVEQLEHVGLLDQIDARHGVTQPNCCYVGRSGGRTGRIYKGWMNILSEPYHPHTFHVNSIQTVLVRLDGHLLRISRPERTMLKHCFHIDPTLTEPEPRMLSQNIYDLTDAKVLLRPRRLARRRWFSRKYPICVKLASSRMDDDHNAGRVGGGGVKRCHSLKQKHHSQQRMEEDDDDQHQQQHNNSSERLDSVCGQEEEEGCGSDGADSAGDSVQSEESSSSTDEKGRMSFCPSSMAQRQQRPQVLSTSPQAPPSPMLLLSASCSTPAAATTTAAWSSSASFGDGCSTATVAHRRRRTTTVPTPRADDDGKAKGRRRQWHHRPRSSACSAAAAACSAYIFLFARSAREKERWFHQLRQATTLRQNAAECFPLRIFPRCTSVPSLERLTAKLSNERVAYTLQNAQFAKQLAAMIVSLGGGAVGGAEMTSLSGDGDCGGRVGAGVVRMDLGWTTTSSSRPTTTTANNNTNSRKEKEEERRAREDGGGGNEFILLVNLIASRVFYDFCHDSYWCGAVRDKIQTKLATIHLPYFIETLELSKLDLGTTTPQIVQVHAPTVNEWGIWCDFDIQYDGLIRLVLETRVNLMKLTSVSESSSSSSSIVVGGANAAGVDAPPLLVKSGDERRRRHLQQRQRHSCSGGGGAPTTTTLLQQQHSSSSITYRILPSRYSDEEIPESPETSPDEEFGSKLKPDDRSLGNGARRMKTGQKLLSLVDRLAHSKYFREASELKLVRKMMEEISSMRLLLNVEVTALAGRMCCNLPPPPSDRLWYAFRTPPRMSVKAVPQVGERSVELSLVSDWIENKLQLILEKNLVLPNMDDVIIPVCSGNKLLQGGLNK